jgi:hypothetical protein
LIELGLVSPEIFRMGVDRNRKAFGFATRSRADPGLDILVVPADGRLLIFIRKCRN